MKMTGGDETRELITSVPIQFRSGLPVSAFLLSCWRPLALVTMLNGIGAYMPGN